MSMKTIVWVSSHPMTAEQLEDLKKFLKTDDTLNIVQVNNLTWFATPDRKSDLRRNGEAWIDLADSGLQGLGEQPIVCGVFPPVALEALFETDFSGSFAPKVLTPVSRRVPELRKGLEALVPFVHLRWLQLAE